MSEVDNMRCRFLLCRHKLVIPVGCGKWSGNRYSVSSTLRKILYIVLLNIFGLDQCNTTLFLALQSLNSFSTYIWCIVLHGGLMYMLKDTLQTLYPGIVSVLVIIWIGYMKKEQLQNLTTWIAFVLLYSAGQQS